MKVSYLILALTCMVAVASINEMRDIPAFLIDDATVLSSATAEFLTLDMIPITHHDYRKGSISIPLNKTPVLLVRSTNSTIEITSFEENRNVPSFHKNYSTLAPIKVLPLSTTSIKKWAKYNHVPAMYKSDGNANSITLPEKQLKNLFIYAPTDNMILRTYSLFPNFVKQFRFRSKRERLASKRTANSGIHLTYGALNSPWKREQIITNLSKAGLDTVVIDFKSFFHTIQSQYGSYEDFMNAPLDELYQKSETLFDLMLYLKANKLITSLRVVVATDPFVQKHNPSILLWNKETNAPWTDHYDQAWVDLFSPEARTYYKKLISIAIRLQPDEIQLDYIRFPTEGNMAPLISRSNSNNRPKYEAVQQFLQEIVPLTDMNNISLAADIFGIVLWELPETRESIGQELSIFARYVDVICPMLYPSHFHEGFENLDNPGAEPYTLMHKGSLKLSKWMKTQAPGSTKMIPWVQAFDYKSPNYGPDYIRQQIKAAYDADMDGVIAWNARNSYQPFYEGSFMLIKKSNF